jgi:hypothetical protein
MLIRCRDLLEKPMYEVVNHYTVIENNKATAFTLMRRGVFACAVAWQIRFHK